MLRWIDTARLGVLNRNTLSHGWNVEESSRCFFRRAIQFLKESLHDSGTPGNALAIDCLAGRRRADRNRAKLSWPPCRFPNPLPRLRVVQRFDAGHGISVAMVSPTWTGTSQPGSHADVPGNYDRDRLPGRGRDHERGAVRTRSDDSGIDLDHGGHRHTRGYRFLFSRRYRDDPHPGNAIGVPLDRNEDADAVSCPLQHSILRGPEDGRARSAQAGREPRLLGREPELPLRCNPEVLRVPDDATNAPAGERGPVVRCARGGALGHGIPDIPDR